MALVPETATIFTVQQALLKRAIASNDFKGVPRPNARARLPYGLQAGRRMVGERWQALHQATEQAAAVRNKASNRAC